MKKPPNIKNGHLFINGIDLYYESVGDGPPVVIVHGGPGLGHGYLYPHFKQMADTYCVIFYDQRSSGRSSGHETPLNITMDNFIEDLEGLRKSLNIQQMALMGHSWGGLVALNYAIRYPQCLQSLVLFSSMGASSRFIHQFRHTVASRLTPKAVQGLNRLAGEFGRASHPAKAFQSYYALALNSYFYDQRHLSELNLGKFTDEMVEKHMIGNAFLADYQKKYTILHQLKNIPCPVLIIHGENDPIPFQAAIEIRDQIKGSGLLLLKECGHFPFIEKRGEFFRAVNEFLVTHLK